MKPLRFIVLKNAAANVVRGGASTIVALILPHFLTRQLSVDRYSAWILILQIAAYANFLDFGLQTAVARYVAQAIERRDDWHLRQVVSTAFFMMLAAAVFALVAAGAIVWQIPHLFRQAPLGLIGELRGGAIVLSAGAALNLLLSTFTGILVGLHRNELPALAIGTTRLAGATAVLIVVRFTPSLVWLALCIAAFNVAGGLWQIAMSLRLLPALHIAAANVTRPMIRELVRYCTGLTVFNFAMVLVGGLDIIIVGYFAFSAAGYYGIAATVVGFVTGMSGAVYTALMAPMAVLQERGELNRIRDTILASSRIGGYVVLAIIILLVLLGKPLLSMWVGPAYAAEALPILVVLLWAQAIRMTASSYSIALIATGQQKYGIAGAVAEGITNLAFSIVGARLMGPVGVAWGTVIGAVCGVLCALVYTMPKAREIPVRASSFALEAILRPAFCFLPLLSFLGVRAYLHPSPVYFSGAVLLTAVLLRWIGHVPWTAPSKGGRIAGETQFL